MNIKARAIIGLLPLALVDAIIPIPIVGLLLLYVIVVQPRWFWKLVRELYGQS